MTRRQAANLIIDNRLKPAQVCELLREIEQEAEHHGHRLAFKGVKNLINRKYFESQDLAGEYFQETLAELRLSEEKQCAVRQALLLVVMFGHVPLPQHLWLAAGCDENLLERLQDQVWLYSSRSDILELDSYLAAWLRQLWLDKGCPWLGPEKDQLPSRLRQVIQAVLDGPSDDLVSAVELLEQALGWVRQALPKLAETGLGPVFTQFKNELVRHLEPNVCDDVVLPFSDDEVSQLFTQNLDQLEIGTLVDRFVTLSRRAPNPNRVSELVSHLHRALADVQSPLPVETIRRMDYALWLSTQLQIPTVDLFVLRKTVINHFVRYSSTEWGWCKTATHFCLNSLAIASAGDDWADEVTREDLFAHAQNFASRLPRHPTSSHGRLDQLNLQARFLELSPQEKEDGKRLEVCRLFYEAVTLSGGRESFVNRLLHAACRFLHELGWVSEVLQVREWAESAVELAGAPPHAVALLAQFLLELSRSLQDTDRRLQLLEDVAVRILAALRECPLDTSPNNRDRLLQRLGEVQAERSRLYQQLGDSEMSRRLLAEVLDLCRKTPADRRSAGCWLTYLRFLQQTDSAAPALEWSEELEWVPPQRTEEFKKAIRQASKAVDSARCQGLRPRSDLCLLLLQLRWWEEGYHLSSAVVARVEKQRADHTNSHEVVYYRQLAKRVKLEQLERVRDKRAAELEQLLELCPDPVIVIEHVRLEEEYNREVARLENPEQVEMTELFQLLDDGQRRWPHDKRLAHARAEMLRRHWEFAEAEKINEELQRSERVGIMQRMAALRLCNCLLMQLTHFLPPGHLERDGKLEKLRDTVHFLEPWPDHAAQVAAFKLRYQIECGATDVVGGLDSLFDEVVGYNTPYPDQLQHFLHSEIIQPDDESALGELKQILHEDCTNLTVLRSLGWAYYRWSKLIRPDLASLWRAYKAFDAVRLLERSWALGNRASVATRMDLGLVALAAIELGEDVCPFPSRPPEGNDNWLKFAVGNLQSACDRSVGRCRKKVLEYLQTAYSFRGALNSKS